MSTQQMDQGNILRAVFDNSTQALNVNIVGSGSPTMPNVVRLSDGVSFLTTTVSGGYRALDVNLIGGNTTVSGTINSNLLGLNVWKTSQATIGTTPVQLAASPLSTRSSLSVKAQTSSGALVYIAPTNTVSSSNGYALFNGDSVQLDLTPTGSIWAVGSAPGQLVYLLELGS